MRGTIITRFRNMRKDVEWVVHPRPSNVDESYSLITIESDHRQCVFDAHTGIGKLSAHAHNYPSIRNGWVSVTVPKEVITAALAAMPQRGDRMGAGVVVIG